MDDIESRLAGIAGVVREQAVACERRREFTPDVLRVLRERGLLVAPELETLSRKARKIRGWEAP